jgi:Lar family restriction alleviation protein
MERRQMTDKLLPCPFCGGDATLSSDSNVEHDREIRYWIVRCQKALCDASVGESCNFSRELAIDKWNSRADTTRIIADFYNRVCDQAERNMALTNMVSGAHWNALCARS